MPLSDITISKKAGEAIEQLKQRGLFSDDKTAAQFAASYAMAKLDLSEFGKLDEYKISSPLNKWHMGDFDQQHFFRSLIKLYYTDVDDPEKALRAVISIGLEDIVDKITNDEHWTILDIL
jgi:hypothetical protein